MNNSKQIYNYTVILEKEEHGGYCYYAFCPILKGCHSQGDSFKVIEKLGFHLDRQKGSHGFTRILYAI